VIAEPLSDYFGVGARFMFLREAKPGMPLEGKGWAKSAIDLFINDIDKFQFNITKSTLSELIAFRKELDLKPEGYKLTDEDVSKLHNIMYSFEKTLEAESQTTWTLAFREKRFPLAVLLQDVSKLFGTGVFSKLPDISKIDLSEAGKCIAMERYTAGAFHILRAMEDIIKDLYLSVIKQNRLKKPMWYEMLDCMRKKKRNRPNEALLDQLGSIRKHYRNPTQHPEKIYDCDEVQDLLASSTAAINMVVKEKQKYI
jgi:hypothetical protein